MMWFYKLFIQAVTFTGDYATVYDQQKRWIADKGDTIILLDRDYDRDRIGKMKIKRLRLYYVPNNFITRMMGFEMKDCLLNLKRIA